VIFCAYVFKVGHFDSDHQLFDNLQTTNHTNDKHSNLTSYYLIIVKDIFIKDCFILLKLFFLKT